MALRKIGLTAALSSSTAAVLTAGANEALTVTKVLACNTGTTARTIDLHHVASGGSAGSTNKIVNARSILGGETITLPISSLFLSNGVSLHAKQDTGTDIILSVNYAKEDQAP